MFESASEGPAARLQQALRAAAACPVVLEITRNRSRVLSARRDPRGGAWVVRAHRMFLDAPPGIVDALAGWLRNDAGARGRLRDHIRALRNREAGIGAGVAPSAIAAAPPPEIGGGTGGSLHSAHVPPPPRPPPSSRNGSDGTAFVSPSASSHGPAARGRHHDLGEYADRLNALYLDGRSRAPVSWSARSPKAGTRSARLAYFDPAAVRIVMSRRLDQASAPRYFVEYVLFHEMLHEVLGIGRRRDGRRDIHGRLFRLMERTYPDYERALAYERRTWCGRARAEEGD